MPTADDRLWFLTSGILRIFRYSGVESATEWFTFPGEMAVDILCYRYGKNSHTGMEAATDTELFAAEKSDFDLWCQNSVYNAIISRKLFEQYALIRDLRVGEFFEATTAEDRYQMILQHYPEILQQIPLGQLASYLCITPQSLSRIRRPIK